MHLKCALVAGIVACTATTSLAQSISGDEIVVTARKREESILKAPVDTTVLTQEQLGKYQTATIYDLPARVPGLLVARGAQASGVVITLRGIGTTTVEASADQSVALNIDGAPMTQGLAYNIGTFDLAQAEVLKGPQALFFGKNSPGGVISLRTADPGEDLEIIARAGHEFEARANRGELIVSGPLNETFGVRLAGMYDHSDGFFRNTAIATPDLGGITPAHKRYPTTLNVILRGTAVWKPAADFTARLKVNYGHNRVSGDGGSPSQLVSCPDGINAPAGINFYAPNEDCKIGRNVNIVDLDPKYFPTARNDGVPFSEQKLRVGSLALSYRPSSDIDISSLTSYAKTTGAFQTNATSSGASGPAIASDNDFHQKDFTQEVRVNTDFNDPLNFTVGAFYQKGTLYLRNGATGNLAFLPAFLETLIRSSHTVKSETKSGFGQLRWKAFSALEIAAGVRYTDEAKTDTHRNLITGSAVLVPLAVPRISSKTWSPEFTVTYTPTDLLTIYGSLKQGYKSGSFMVSNAFAPGTDNSFGDERVRGAEVGLKARSSDGSFRTSIAAYHYKYSGLQVGAAVTPLGGLPVIEVLNAASAKIYGIDWDASYRPPSLPELRLNLSANLNRARFGKFENAPCWGGQTVAQGCDRILNPVTGLNTAQDLSGGKLVRAPGLVLSGGFDYDIPIGDRMTLSFGSSSNYTSRYLTDIAGRSDMFQKAFFKTDANVTLMGPDERWTLSLIGNNLTNKLVKQGCDNTPYATGAILPGTVTGGTVVGPAGIDEVFCRVQPGRELWVRASIKL